MLVHFSECCTTYLKMALKWALWVSSVETLLLLQVALPPGPAETVAPHSHEVDVPDVFCSVWGGSELLAAVMAVVPGIIWVALLSVTLQFIFGFEESWAGTTLERPLVAPPVTMDRKLMISGKLTVLYPTMMFDWRGCSFTLYLVPSKTSFSDKKMALGTLPHIMALFVIL